MESLNNDNRHISFSIAGMEISVYGNEVFKLFKYLDGFQEFISLRRDGSVPCDQEFINLRRDGSVPCWKIHFDMMLPKRKFNSLYHFDFEGVDCDFGFTDGRYVFTMIPRDSDIEPLQMEYAGNDEVFVTRADHPTILRFALWMAFNLLGASRKIFAIHSSCVVYNNKAVLFLGESGTGKSTHAGLWYNNFADSFLLNDDSPIISSDNGKIMVHGSPWSGKTPCFRQERYELEAVVRLSQSSANEIHKLSTIESVGALYPSFSPAFAFADDLSEKVLALVSDIIKQVPVYQMNCLPNIEAAEMVKHTLFK